MRYLYRDIESLLETSLGCDGSHWRHRAWVWDLQRSGPLTRFRGSIRKEFRPIFFLIVKVI